MSKRNSISRIWWLLLVAFLLWLPASPALSHLIEEEEITPTTGCDDLCEDEEETGDEDGEEDPECSEDTDDGSVRANYMMHLFPEENGFLRGPVSWVGHGDISKARRLFGFGWEFPFPYGLQYTKDDTTQFQVKSTRWNVENFRNTEGSTWVADRWQGDRSSNGPNVSLTVEGQDIVYRHQTKRGSVQTMTMESTWSDVYVPTSLVDSKGRETTFEWVQSVFPTAIQQSVDGQDRRLEFGTVLGLDMGLPFGEMGDYFGMISVVVLSVKDSGDSWDGIEGASSQHVRRACFIYLNQQLVSIEIQVPTIASPRGHLVEGWEAVSRYVFRYDSLNQLRLVIEPAFYAKFVNSEDYDPAEGPGWQVLSGYAGDLDYSVAASYASYSYQYDGNGDVTSVVRKSGSKQCGTGSGKPSSDITVEHSRTANTPAASDVYNEWTTCRVRNFRNAAGDVVKRITKYNNFFQQPIFCMVEEGDDIETDGYDIRHADFYVYDADGRMIMHAEDSALDWSAIDGYEDEGLADLAEDYDDILNISGGASAYLANSEGVIRHKTYGSSTTATTSTAGDVHGQVKEKNIQIGDGGSITTLVDYQYKLFTKLSGEQVAVAVQERRYVDSDGTYEKVTSAYALLDLDDDTNDDSEQRTTTRYVCHAKMSGGETFYKPDGTVDGGGSTKTLTTIAIRDDVGRLIWVKNEIGLIDYYEYDDCQLATRIKDVDTSETGDFANLPSGWSTNGTYGGLHLVTDYSYDDELGRVTQVLGPEHKIDIGGTLTAVRSAKWVVRIEDGPTALDERWTLRGYQKTSDSDNNSRDSDECRTTTLTYNGNGQVLTRTAMDPNADGTETDNQVTTYVYSGQLSSYTSPVKREDLLIGTIYPDSDGVVVSQALDDGADTDYDRVELEYNAAGSIAEKTDQRAVEIDYTYCDDGQLKLQAVTLPGGSAVDDTVLSIEKAYNDLGRLMRATSYDDAQGSAGTSNEVNEVILAYNDWGKVATSWQVLETEWNDEPEAQYVWGVRYIDGLVMLDRDLDSDDQTGSYGLSGSGLEERHFYCTDAYFSLTALVEPDGTVAMRYEYDAYGLPSQLLADFSYNLYRWLSRSVPNLNVTYRGYWLRTHQRLYFVRNRAYDPSLGRWLQRDPLGYVDGMNLYEYVRSFPVSSSDPLGLAMHEDLDSTRMCTGNTVFIITHPIDPPPADDGSDDGDSSDPPARSALRAVGTGDVGALAVCRGRHGHSHSRLSAR